MALISTIAQLTIRKQTDRTEVVNGTMEMYLRCFTGSQPKEWMKWLPWAEYCYNSNWHSSIKKTPFEVVYGRSPPSLLTYVPRTTKVDTVEQELTKEDQIVKDLRINLKEAQSRMKKIYDAHHREREFAEED